MVRASIGLAALNQNELATWASQAISQAQIGRLPDYIPLLAAADPGWFAVQVQLNKGATYSYGLVNHRFPLMSVVKPFLLLFLLQQLGSETVFSRVGMAPSDQPFHSLGQLIADKGFPRNPMLNSGAIALAGLLPGTTGSIRCEALRQWLNQQSGSQLQLDEAMLASVRSLDNQANRSIATVLNQSGYLDAIDVTLDTYNHICCLSGTVVDVAMLGMLLTRLAQSATPKESQAVLPAHQQTVNAIMLTCGLYEASGPFAVRVGLPTKSGVGGAVLSVVPGEGAIACYSPLLDQTGNPIAGLRLLEAMARSLNLSIFS